MSNVVQLVPKGRTFVRGLIASTLCTGDCEAFASRRWGMTQASAIAKAAVSAIGSGDVGTPEAREFFSLASEQSLLGRIASLRRIPFNVRSVTQTQGATVGWVMEGNPIPLSKPAIEGFTLPSLKVGGIIVSTKEALLAMGDVAEAALQRDLLNTVSRGLDAAFIDPGSAGIADTMPASVTYGQTQIASAGPTAANARADIRALFAAYQGDWRTATVVMHPQTAVQLGLLDAELGDTKLTVQGGVLVGVPVVCSSGVPLESSGGSITLLDADAIAFAARDFTMEVSDETSLYMSDTPTSPAQLVSMFATNSVAWKAAAEANWETQGTGRVATVTGVDYAGV